MNNWDGIHLSDSRNSIISNCSINLNGLYGLRIYDFYGINFNNKVFHNHFSNNNNAYDEAINYWDNGYPSGGNYWGDDYEGVDVYPLDGIGDTPYTIDGGGDSEDTFPLMNPWNGTSPLNIS